MIDWHPLDQDEPPRPVPHNNSDVTTNDIYAMLGGEMLPADIHHRRLRAEADADRRRRMNNLEAYFATFHTRELLDLLRRGTSSSGQRDVWIVGLGVVDFDHHMEVIVRKALAGCEHIPNKEEAKSARRLAARRNYGQAKRRDR